MFLQSCLFVSMACQDWLRLVGYRFRACPGSFKTSPVQKIPNEKAGRPLVPDKPGCIMSCRGGETDPDFTRPFLWIFAPDFCS